MPNLAETLNTQIKRRTRVAALFPNEASALRLVTAVLMDISEEWENGRPAEFTLTQIQQKTQSITNNQINLSTNRLSHQKLQKKGCFALKKALKIVGDEVLKSIS